MSETNYFWQGGRRIEVKPDENAITIHAESEADAQRAAERAGVDLEVARPVAPGLVSVRLLGDRDRAMTQLRDNHQVVHHVYRDAQDFDNEYLITESFFIKFKPGTPDSDIQAYLQTEHLVMEQNLGNNTFLVRVTDTTGRNPIRTANAAASRPDVEYAEPNLVRRLTRFFIPSDPLFSRQWHLHAPVDVAPDLAAGAGIFAADAWDITRGRRDIVVAVADDGFDLTHPDFQGEGKVVARLNATIRRGNVSAGIDWDENVQPRPGDYHGTPCLGVAVAEGNGTGVVGVAPNCSLVAVRFPLSMSDAHFVLMFQKISTLADVVSCSWGVGPANAPMSSTFRDALTILTERGGRRGKGLIICVAAGNNNCPVQDLNNTRTYQFRTRFGIQRYSGPIDRWIAAHPKVITVSASTSRMTRSAYSSWGKNISVCAPSDNWDDLGLTNPTGLGITTTDNENAGSNSDFTPGSRFTDHFGGTSSATPTVAGVCGLILSANPSLTAEQVKELLEQTADKNLNISSDTMVNEPGDFDADGFSLWFGHGKVNAFRAVEKAAQGTMAQETADVEERPGLSIPDRGRPVTSSITINDTGTISDFRIKVDITHTYIGDLRVDLLAPDGTAVSLHSNTGGSTHNLIKIYSVQEFPALRSLLGKPIQGTWQLRVVDTFWFDVGTLNSWRIVARLAAPAPLGGPPQEWQENGQYATS